MTVLAWLLLVLSPSSAIVFIWMADRAERRMVANLRFQVYYYLRQGWFTSGELASLVGVPREQMVIVMERLVQDGIEKGEDEINLAYALRPLAQVSAEVGHHISSNKARARNREILENYADEILGLVCEQSAPLQIPESEMFVRVYSFGDQDDSDGGNGFDRAPSGPAPKGSLMPI